ncbi:MAG: c-type cytochrome [Verrucomicrobiota bacterium]
MNTPIRPRLSGTALFVGLLLAAGGPVFAADTPAVLDGATIYQENCATCHRRGKAGAIPLTDTAAWSARVKEHGRDHLVKRAISGFSTPAGDEMPPRGGNDELNDAQVAAAVDHIISQTATPQS